MSGVIEFVQLRGEYASIFAAAALLALAARPVTRLLALPRREVGDLFWNGGVAFVVAGRLAYLATEAPSSLLDPLVLVRIQGGQEVAMKAHDFWRTPGGVEHSVRTGDEGALVLDIFAPPRDEYRKAGEGFDA